MIEPLSHVLPGKPRLHYLEWNPRGRPTVILLHGSTANAWWWHPVARAISPAYRLLALDQRGHGDSEWVRPPAYSVVLYAHDLARFAEHVGPRGELPIIVGHSLGGMSVLAFARDHPGGARGVVLIDGSLTASRASDRYFRRLKSLPIVTYPDLETAKARFRLMPREGSVPPETLLEIAEKSFARTDEGRFTLKFDRESFYRGDGIQVMDALRQVRIPTLLVRAGRSRIMNADGARAATESNPRIQLVTIPDAHHHVLLEKPAALARVIEDFIASL
ncbi:MAG TPA: alpha/beta hydrolase [Candidatus Binataceae bacterium]|nr:alpha/beta hydrolase [Candidatus Binataceae bacterium]